MMTPSILKMLDCSIQGIELAFALDVSGSISASIDNFQLVRNFLGQVVERFVIGPQATRVAVITYSNTAVVNFDFQNFMTREEVLEAVQSLGMCLQNNYCKMHCHG